MKRTAGSWIVLRFRRLLPSQGVKIRPWVHDFRAQSGSSEIYRSGNTCRQDENSLMLHKIIRLRRQKHLSPPFAGNTDGSLIKCIHRFTRPVRLNSRTVYYSFTLEGPTLHKTLILLHSYRLEACPLAIATYDLIIRFWRTSTSSSLSRNK